MNNLYNIIDSPPQNFTVNQYNYIIKRLEKKMDLKFELDVIKARRNTMVEYLVMKVRDEDWHAVADAAMDLREIEVELKIAHKIELIK